MQEISSLVGEGRVESSEAETVATVTTAAAEGEEPMQTNSHSGLFSAEASVLQVNVEGSNAAAQVHTHTHTHTHTHHHPQQQLQQQHETHTEMTNQLVSLRWRRQTAVFLRS